MRVSRHFISTAVLWVILTAIGEALVFSPLFPTAGSLEADDFDKIFRTLCIMGVPVFAFVIATLAYSVTQFRGTGAETDNGRSFWGTGNVPKVWIAITSSLAVMTMIYPGLTGLSKLQSDPRGYGWGKEDPELVVQVTAFRFGWQYDFPATGQRIVKPGAELYLPVDTEIKFEVNSIDVIHSFWIPAFRMKIDAIPGRTTFFTVETTAIGEYESDEAFRVQCAELCGLDHSKMRSPIKVVEQDEFQTWLAEQPQATN